jgi:hypothetical protein
MSDQSGSDAFKEVFKFYKRRDKPLDMNAVIDFDQASKWSDRIQPLEPNSTSEREDDNDDLIQHSDWKIFKLLPESDSKAGDGIYYIKNPFTNSGLP